MIDHKKLSNFLFGIALFGLMSGIINAQTIDGDLGATSQGQINIELEVTDSVEISSLSEISFPSYGGNQTGGINEEIGFCVYVNGGDGYTITPTSSNGKFALIGPTNDEIEYTVKFAGSAAGAASSNTVAYNTASSTFNGSKFRYCDGGLNASLNVGIEEQEIRDATTGEYTDILILLVNPV